MPPRMGNYFPVKSFILFRDQSSAIYNGKCGKSSFPQKDKCIITVHIKSAQELLTQQHLSEQNSLEHLFKDCKADSRFREVEWKGVP